MGKNLIKRMVTKKGIFKVLFLIILVCSCFIFADDVKAADITISLDYNNTYNIPANQSMNSGFKVNWDNSFAFQVDFSVPSTNGTRMLVFSNRNGSSVTLDSYLTEGGNFNAWAGNVAIECNNAITANKTYNVTYWWFSDSKTLALLIKDVAADTIVCSKTATSSNLSGATSNPVYFNGDVNDKSTIAMNKLKIIIGSSVNSGATVPSPSGSGFDGYTTGWYTAASGGDKVTSYPTSDTTLYLQKEGINTPATPTISGGATKVYNSSDTTLTCNTSTAYPSGITTYYRFGYATSDGGTPGNWSAISTSNTHKIAKDAYVGQRWYSCRVYASDGTYTSSATSLVSADTAMTINNASITFNVSSNGGTLSGTSPLYSKYGVADLYTAIRNTTVATVPTATKTGYTFQGWYTAASGGSKVINYDKSAMPDVSDWTDSSKNFLRTANSTLYAQFSLNTPATPTISGGATKIYNSTATTLTCATATTYSSGVNLYYSFGYATSDGGTPGNWTTASATNTYTVAKNAYVGQRWYSCRVYATDGTLSSSTVASLTTADTAMTINNAKITFNVSSNGGTLSGTSPLYSKYGVADLYTGIRNTTTATIPTATKTNYTFDGWYTAASGGDKVINADKSVVPSVSNWTNASKQFLRTADSTLYAHYSLNAFDVTYDYQMNKSFTGSATDYYDTGYTIDFDKNFEIEETFRVDELNKKYLIFGSYDAQNSSDEMLQVVVNYTNNRVVSYVGSLSGSKTSTGTITAGEDITAKFTWNATTKAYVLTLKGTTTDITVEGTSESLSGKCVKTLRLGYDRGRADGYWSPIKVSSFKITTQEVDGTVLTDFPEAVNNKKYLAWRGSIIDEDRITSITVDEDKTLYAADIPIYKVMLDDEEADTTGTTEYYYAHNISRVIDGTTCYYYTDSNLENCIVSADFVIPTKEHYNFGGYYSKQDGEGAQYITSAGVFTNNIYKKKPVDINEDYFDTITLYAKWRGIHTLTYDYQNDDTFTGNQESYFDTGYKVNFNKDFEIEETFRVNELDKHYFLIGSYHAAYSSNKFFQVSVNTGNTIRVYMGSVSNYIDSTETINPNEDINLKINWDFDTKTYTLTAKGTVTDITMSGTYSDLTGVTVRTLRLGYDRGRADGYWSPIEVSNLKISNEEDYGNVITALPNASKEGYRLGWYDEATGGNRYDMYTVDGNKTLYAVWIEQKNLTYDYLTAGEALAFDGTAESKFNTGYQLNFDKDFEIEETFSVSELGSRALIISSVYTTSTKSSIMIEKTAADKIRVFLNSNEVSSNHDFTSEETIAANEDITVKFVWDAGTKTYTLTATGLTTNISFSNTYEVKGYTNRTLCLGQDHRTTVDFGPVTVSSLKITESEDINSEILELPKTTKDGSKLIWYDAPTSGNKVTDVTMDDDKTIYATWGETANLTYDYIFNTPLQFTGGDESYFDTDYTIDWGKDFEIEETVKLPELGKRYLLFGGYKTDSDLGNRINVEFTASGNIRIFGKSETGYVTDRQDSTGTLYANEDITVKFIWNSGTQTFTITAQGEQTDMILSAGMTGMTGKATRPLRLGQDYRGAAVYAPMEVSSFKTTTAEEIGTVVTDFPEVTVGGSELKWYDASFGGNEVTTHTLDADTTIYGHFPIYSVILSSEDADIPGTTEVYYEYNVRRTIDDVTCYYYSDATLTNCITNGKRIEIPEKENYNFVGYYAKEDGTGISYVNESGDFINSLYVKHPNEIDSSYTDSITLYPKWSHEQTLTYDYQNDDTFTGNQESYFDTGYKVNFNKDFEIEETFRVNELDKHYFLIGSYHGAYSSNKFFQASVNTDNTIRVYIGSVSNYIDSTETINPNEEINLKINWDFDTKTYTLTAKGTVTDITMSGTYSDLTGVTVRTLRLGYDRGRADEYWSPIEVSNLKISNEEDYGNVITALPNASKEGYRLGWYDETTGGNKIEMLTVEDDMTLYAQWVEQKKLTYDYQINESFDGTAESFFNTGYKINFDKDFEIEETFRLTEIDRRNLIIGSYYSTSSSNKPVLNIEVTAANKLRVYMLSTLVSSAHSTESTETVPADEDITIKYSWDAATNTYTVTATGATTNISMTGTYEVVGLADRAMRLGQDQRTATTFGPITVSSLKITESEDMNAVISELPTPTRDGDKLEWYTSSSEGDKVTSVTMDDNKTIYANWTEQKELTYEYQNDNSFDGTDDSYFDTGYVIDWDKDFEIEETFRISKLNKKYLLIGSYESSTDKGQNIDVLITTDNKVQVYVTRNSGGNNSYVSFSGQLVVNEDINFKFVWEAGEQKYTVTLIGNNTNFSYSNRLGYMVGKASHTLRLGQDQRGYSAFEPIEVKNLKIKTKEIEGIVIDDFPALTKEGHTVNWYDQSTGGNIITSAQLDTDKTIYAQYMPNTYIVMFDNENADSEGTNVMYYQYDTSKEIDGATCYYYTSNELTTCLTNGKVTIPEKEHYIFDGYYTAENGIGTKYIDEDGEILNDLYQIIPSEIEAIYTDTITLYANWIGEEVTVTLPDDTVEIYHYGDTYNLGTNDIAKANDNLYEVTFNYQDGVTSDEVRYVETSYTPNGWLVDGEATVDDTELTLTKSIVIDYNYTEEIINPTFPEPTRDGYMFDGWYKSTDWLDKVTSEDEIKDDITLYARWIEDIREDENQCIIVKPDETTVLVTKGESYNLGTNSITRTSEEVSTITFKYQDGETLDTTDHVLRTFTPDGWLVNDTEYIDEYSYVCNTDMAVIGAKYEEEIVSPEFPEPTRSHYTFDGWYDEDTLVESYIGDEDITLNARWTGENINVTLPDDTVEIYHYGDTYTLGINEEAKANDNLYEVTFNYQDGETLDTTDYVFKTYTPNGWLVNEEEKQDDEVLVLTEDIEIDYNYTEEIINPTFPEPTRTSYMFDGWYKSTDWLDKVTSEDEINDDITLYARWIEDIRENEDQCIIVKPDDTTVLVTKGESYNLGTNSITRTSEEVSTITFKYQDGETLDTTDHVLRTFTPDGWLVNDTEYIDEYSYVCNTDMAVIRAKYEEEIVSPEFPEPTRSHYTFDGWFDEDTLVESYTGNEDITLNAHWTGDEVNVTLPDDTVEIYHYGDTYTLGTNEEAKANDNGAAITFKYQDGETADEVLYVGRSYTPAGWLVNDVVTIDDTVLTLVEDIVIEYNYDITKTSPEFSEPTREHYTFDGWYDEDNLVESYTGDEDIILNAHWTGDEVNVTLPDDTIEVHHYGDSYDLGINDVSKANDNGASITFKYQDGETVDEVLYVINSYTPAGWLVNDAVTVDDTVLTLVEDIEIDYNYDVTKTSPTFPEPTREHYTFDGWYDEDTLVESYTGDEDITLFAHWTGDEVNVTLPDDTVEIYHYGDTYNLGTNDIAKANDNGAAITFKYQDGETADEVLYVGRSYTPAGWLVNDVVTIDDTVLTLVEDIVIEYNYDITKTSPEFSEPTREHYTFDGWYDEDNLVESYTGDEDIILNAHWTGDEVNVTLPDDTIEVHHYGDSYDLGINDVSKANDNGAAITFKYQDGETADEVLYVGRSYTPAGWLVNDVVQADDTVLTLVEDIVIEYNYDITKTSPEFPEPTREHYTFDGWFDEDTLVESYTGDEDITLFAHWTGDEVNVTLPDDTVEIYHYGDTYNLGTNDVSKANDNGASITFKYQDGETADEVLYVGRSYTPNGWLVNDVVTIDDTVLTLTEDIEINYNYDITKTSPTFPQPTRDNYTFDGWYDEEEEGNLIESYIGDEDIILYAYWTLDKPSDFTLDIDELTLVISETHQIVPTFIPDGTTDDLVYSGYDNEVISITSEGLITALSPGETTITVALESDPTVTKTIDVTVLNDKFISDTLDAETKDLGRIIIGSEPETTVATFISNLSNPSEYIEVYTKEDELVEDSEELIKTGMKVKLVINGIECDEAIIIIRGDLDEDGLVEVSDGVVLQEHILYVAGKRLTDYRLYAGDIDYNESATIEDMLDVTDGDWIDKKILKKIPSLNHLD